MSPSVERLKRKSGPQKWTWFIYGLMDPRDMSIRYIGRTLNPESRPYAHWTHPSGKIRDWNETMDAAGVRPYVVLLERTRGTFERACELESGWIRYGLEAGWPLLNVKRDTSGNAGHPEIAKQSALKAKETNARNRALWLSHRPVAVRAAP